jgi:hypothetical protein
MLILSPVSIADDSQSPVSLEERVDRLFAKWDKGNHPERPWL